MRSMLRSTVRTFFSTGVMLFQTIGCKDAVAPNEASIKVIVRIAGAFPSDRLVIQIDGRPTTVLVSDGSLTVKGLSAGEHSVSLSELPPSCAVEGANPRTVQISADLSTVVFGLNCPAAGTLAFVSTREGAPHIYVASADGTGVKRLVNQFAAEFSPAWSPDGQRLAFNSVDGSYVINRDGSGLRRLQSSGRSPSWSPDGKLLLVTDTTNFRIIPVDDPDAPAVDLRIDDRSIATYGITWVSEGTWSPDGSRIAFSAWTGMDMQSLFVMNADGTSAEYIVHGNATWDECGPEWSPTGQHIAVLSMVLRAAAIVQADGGTLQPVFNPGTACWDNHEPGEQSASGLAWSPDGKAMAVTTRTPSWQPNSPWPQNQRTSIAIVDVGSGSQLTLIPDAYDPTWTK